MKQISKDKTIPLSIAESMMLLEPQKSTGKEMLINGIKECVLQEKLNLKRKKKKIPGRGNRGYTLLFTITRGQKFDQERPNRVNHPLLMPFLMHPIIIPLPFYASRVILEVGDSYSKYKHKHVAKSLIEKGLIKPSILNALNFYQLTEKGKKVRAQFIELLDICNQNFHHWLHNSPEKVIDIVRRLGSNFILIEDLSFKEIGQRRISLAESFLAYIKTPPETNLPNYWFTEKQFQSLDLFSLLTNEQFSFSFFEEPFTGNLELGFENEFDDNTLYRGIRNNRQKSVD